MSEKYRKRIQQHKINNRGTPTHASYLSRFKRNNTSPDVLIKSYYCLEEISKVPYEKKTNVNKTKPRNTVSVGHVASKENGEVDIIFLKKLLSVNKKQELLINKKLSELLREQDLKDSKEKRNIRHLDDSSSSESVFKAKKYNVATGLDRFQKRDNRKAPSFNTAQKKKEVLSTPPKAKITYDINGRRVYHLSDSEGEVDERWDSSENSETNTNMGRQSDSSIDGDDMLHDRNFRKDTKQPIQVQHNRNSRRRYQSEHARSSATCPSRLVKSTIEIGLQEKEKENMKNRSQTVVAHCREVPRDQENSEWKKKILRVWDYKSIPKYGEGDITKHSQN